MCFVAGTPVWTVDGTKSIELIQPGDLVLSRDPDTGVQEYKPVVQTFITHPDAIYHLSYTLQSNQTLRMDALTATGTHPFYVINRGEFVPVKDLRPGDTFLLENGATATFNSDWIEYAPEGRSFTTYNFEVRDFHTYFVGTDGLWVHNKGELCKAAASQFASVARKLGFKEAFEQVLAKLPAESKGSLGLLFEKAMQAMYADATTGAVDVSKVMSFTQLDDLISGLREANKVQVNHTVPKYIMRWLGIAEEELDNVPAEILEIAEHQGQDGSFHRILIKKGLGWSRQRPLLSDNEMLNLLKETYDEFDRPNVWKVAKEWLRLKGIE